MSFPAGHVGVTYTSQKITPNGTAVQSIQGGNSPPRARPIRQRADGRIEGRIGKPKDEEHRAHGDR